MSDVTTHPGKFVAVQYEDESGNWRVKINRKKEGIRELSRQTTYLAALAEHGRTMDAANAAGVSAIAVRRLRDQDPEFDEACIDAMATYRDRLIAHHQDLVFEGQTKITYDRQGNVVSEEKVYPVRLIELELKKHDEGYRDKREVDMKVSGGVLVAPANVATIDEWEARFASGPVIDVEAQESDKTDLSSGDSPER